MVACPVGTSVHVLMYLTLRPSTPLLFHPCPLHCVHSPVPQGSATFASTSVALCRCAGRPHSLLPSVSTLPRCALCCRPRSRQSSSPPKRRVGSARGVAADRPCSAELRAPMRPCTRRWGKCFGTRTWRATTMTTTARRVAVGAATQAIRRPI